MSEDKKKKEMSLADKINFKGKRKRNKRKELRDKKKKGLLSRISEKLGF